MSLPLVVFLIETSRKMKIKNKKQKQKRQKIEKTWTEKEASRIWESGNKTKNQISAMSLPVGKQRRSNVIWGRKQTKEKIYNDV